MVIECLTERLEAGSSGVSHATRHALKELLIVEATERQPVVHLHLLHRIVLVPEKMKWHLGMSGMPSDDLVVIACIEHVTMDIVPVGGLCAEHLGS